MQTERKVFYKTLLFWELAIGGLVLLAAIIIIIVGLSKPVNDDPKDESSSYQSEDTGDQQGADPIPANPIGLGDFAMEGEYLTCLTTPSVLGIDVSYWQGGTIDWQQVKAAGVEFAMIRAGWRGSEQGVLAEDDYAQINYAGATAAGIKVGAYFFSQAVSVTEAVEEANFLLDIIKDWRLEMPVVYDWEFVSADSRTGKVSARTLTDCTKAFCNTVALAGYEPMVYFNKDQSFERLYLNELTQYGFWLAQYDTVLNYPYKIDMWQYTETGAVPGIPGDVDINVYFQWE